MQSNKIRYFRICLFTVLFFLALFYSFSSTFKLSNINAEKVVVSEAIEIPKNETKPIFIIKSYIYQNSIIYKNNDAIITLFNGEQANYSATPLFCRRKLSNGKVEKVPAEISMLVPSPPFCKLLMYRTLCVFSASCETEETVIYEIGGAKNGGIPFHFQELILSKPEIKKRTFVSCMSRMIAFENWALLITALETYRFYGGDLMVAYVECALKDVIELMEMYEKDGILRVEPAYKGAEISNAPYDPDGEAEYSNQLTNAHQCLYEYKESAEFIAFTDWDDILIGTPQFPKFADALRPHSLANPNAGEFTIDRFDTYMKKAFRPNSPQFSLKTLEKSLISPKKVGVPKFIIRPSFILGIWIHQVWFFEDKKFNRIHVNETSAFIMHLSNLILDIGEKEEFLDDPSSPNQNASNFLNGKILQQNMEQMFKKYKYNFNSSVYSYSKPFHKVIQNCYETIRKKMFANKMDFCPSHKYCNYPKQNLEVMKVETKHKKPFKLAEFIWYERKNVKFIESNQGCF